jgi:hypothetical protein
MKKKIMCIAFVAAIAIAATWSFNQSNNEMVLSDVALSNIEALANGEELGNGYYGYKMPRIDCFGCPIAYTCGGTGIISC